MKPRPVNTREQVIVPCAAAGESILPDGAVVTGQPVHLDVLLNDDFLPSYAKRER